MSFQSTSNPVINAFNAAEDIQGQCIVAIDPTANFQVKVSTGGADANIGLSYHGYEHYIEEGCIVDVQYHGIGSVKLSGTVAPGDKITSDGSGAGVLAVAGDNYVGCAIEGGVAGQIISIIIKPGIA